MAEELEERGRDKGNGDATAEETRPRSRSNETEPSPMTSIEDFRQRAVECERVAETTISPYVREMMSYVASRWRAIADEDEARAIRARPPSDHCTPPNRRGSWQLLSSYA